VSAPSVDARFVAPWTPSEKMWGGLARSIMMWLSFGPRHTPKSLLDHLERSGAEVPQWLLDEPEMQSLDHSMSKGTRCVLIYRAMLWDGRAEHLTPSGHTPDCEYHCEQYPHECTCGVAWLPAPVRVALAASAIEARRAATENTGAVHESAAPSGETPNG
jgi:hypothetical protein